MQRQFEQGKFRRISIKLLWVTDVGMMVDCLMVLRHILLNIVCMSAC